MTNCTPGNNLSTCSLAACILVPWLCTTHIQAGHANMVPAIEKRGHLRTEAIEISSYHLQMMDPERDWILPLQLFDEGHFDVVFEHAECHSITSVSWYGRLQGLAGSSVVLVAHNGAVSAHIEAPGLGVFEIQPAGGGIHHLIEIGAESIQGCGCDARHSLPPPAVQHAGPRGGDDGSLIDVLVLYTTAARQGAGGVNNIESLIQLAVNLTNAAFANSEISPRIRLVHRAEIAYNEPALPTDDDLFDALEHLTSATDGIMDGAHTLRDTYGADLVALIVNNCSPNFCGYAWIMGAPDPGYESLAFSVTARTGATANLTFPHELGHNLGCAHDRDNAAGPGAYSYAYGHRFGGAAYRTIMSYPPGQPITVFSNPAVTHNGQPTGVPIGEPGEAHNAQTINNTSIIVANYRQSIPADVIAPQPNPMTFASPPFPLDTTKITMTATVGTDDTPPIQYLFEETTGTTGGTNSGWQLPSSYVDSDLLPNTPYAYRVKARDNAQPANETFHSDVGSTCTHIQSPVGMAFLNVTNSSVQMTATGTFTNLTVGQSGILFDVDPPGDYGGAGVWLQTNSVAITDLLAGRSYNIRARARNQIGLESNWGPWTLVETIPLIGDCNDDGVFSMEGDLPCFVDALLGYDIPEGAVYRSDLNFDGQTDANDIVEMVNCLIYGCN